ncbi:hypothetical protein JYT34_00620 [Olleya sp. AH-315-K02]|nr:hypothetical protein [Olleya sp. AH-315-K02]
MKVLNVHKRIIGQPKENVSKLLETLSTKDDKIWPNEKWPAIRFKNGLKIGSRGGHGIIRYTIVDYIEGEHIKFRFTKPKGFHGTHEFNIIEHNLNQVEINHIIKMKTSGVAIFTWPFAIRWLHDALIENAFDNIENSFSTTKVKTKWNFWVKFLRFILK